MSSNVAQDKRRRYLDLQAARRNEFALLKASEFDDVGRIDSEVQFEVAVGNIDGAQRPTIGESVKARESLKGESGDQRPAARIEFAFALGHSSLFGGNIAGAPEVFARETDQIPDRDLVDFIHRYLTHVSRFFTGDVEYVIGDAADAMAEAFRLGLVRPASAIGTDYALSLFYAGDVEAARTAAVRLTEAAEEKASPSLYAWSMYVQGEIEGVSDPDRAIEMLEDAVESSITVENEFVAGISLVALSSIAGRNGDMETAFDAMYRCIRLWRAAGNRPQMWTAVRNLVEMLHSIGSDADALVLNAAVEADADRAPDLFGPFGDQYRAILRDIEAALDAADAADAKRRGALLDYPAAASFALDAIARAQT